MLSIRPASPQVIPTLSRLLSPSLRQTAARLGYRLQHEVLSTQMLHHPAIWAATLTQPERAVLMNVLPVSVLLRNAWRQIGQRGGWQAALGRLSGRREKF